ncbi:MAG TPA: hypothetical protein VD928_02820 [Candidatus Paceibacterota bacterium]|nr:hypothetical protein [Candidatus Paceibacterota bacterium]
MFLNVFIAFAAALCLGGGVSAVAHNAEPGDALYEYKVQVNDRVAAGVDATVEGAGEVGATIQNAFDFTVDADVEAESNSDARVSHDADASAIEADTRANAEAEAEANLDTSIEINL